MQRGARGPGLNNVCSLKSKGNVRTLSSVLLGSFYADMTLFFFFFLMKTRERNQAELLFFIY
jgi:hypothetical protein